MIKVDGKIRRDPRFPLGMMDVVTIEKTNENFRILLDTKGRFLPHRIDHKEAGFKLCKVIRKRIGKAKVPHIVTHVRDASGNSFSTRLQNVMVIGDSKNTIVSLPK